MRGGDTRSDNKNIEVATLGGIFSRDTDLGGYKIDYIYKTDPDYPDQKSPLDDPYLDIRVEDVITHINGKEALSAVDIGALIQLDKAIEYLQQLIKEDPREVPLPPAYPDKSFKNNKK